MKNVKLSAFDATNIGQHIMFYTELCRVSIGCEYKGHEEYYSELFEGLDAEQTTKLVEFLNETLESQIQAHMLYSS